jgi:osmotically-inducible protein OsmY
MAEATMARSSQDTALAGAAAQALIDYSGVQVWADALDITANNGIVEIGGHVRTRAEREVTENVLLKTPGVKDVISHLYVDTDLEIKVGKALGDDPRTRGSFPGILVGSAFGDIYLKGGVASQDIKKAASEIATKVDGVRSVINSLEISEALKAAPAGTDAKPTVAGTKPVVAVKPPVAGAVKPAITPVKPPAPGAVKPNITPVKPPTSVGAKSNITPVKPPNIEAIKARLAASKAAPKPAEPKEEKAEGEGEAPAQE